MNKHNGDFSVLLKNYRDSKWYTQEEAGKYLGYSHETIKAWEGGKRFPRRKDLPRLAHLMGCDLQELEQIINADRLKASRLKVCRTTALANEASKAQDGTPALLVSQEYGTISGTKKGTPGKRLIPLPDISETQESGLQDMDAQRRKIVEQALEMTGAAMIAPLNELVNSDVLERLAIALKKPSCVDQTTLTQLESITRKKRQRLVTSEGADWYDLFCEASGHLSVITKLLEQSQPTSTYTTLCALAGETTLLMGDIFFNAGQNETSGQYYTMALDAAKEAHHHVLQAVVLGRMSFIPIYGRNPAEALPLLDQAQLLVKPNTADIIPAWLWAIAGEAHANIGNRDASFKALEQAEALLKRGRTGNVSFAFAEDTAYALFSPLRMLSYKGTCYISLKRPLAAQTILRASLASLDSTHLHHKSIGLVDLGMTYVQQVEIKDACDHANQALNLIEQTRSGRVFQRVLKLRRELEPWKNMLYVNQLDEHIVSMLKSGTFRGNA